MKYDTDFKYLIPPLSKEEYNLLKENILKEGCRDAILLWTEMLTDGTESRTMILDGHNRYEICTKNKIPFETKKIGHEQLKDMKEARIWVIQNQLGRRNLTGYQRGKLTLELKTMIQEKAKEKQREHGGTAPGKSLSQKSDEVSTGKELAKLARVSHDTIHKIEVIEKEAPPEIKEQVSKGEISIHRAYKEVRRDQKTGEQKKISRVLNSIRFEQLRREWEAASKDERRQFLRITISSVKDKLNRYRFSNESNFSESEKEYYANIDERTVDIILKFGIYYNEVPRFTHRKKIQ